MDYVISPLSINWLAKRNKNLEFCLRLMKRVYMPLSWSYFFPFEVILIVIYPVESHSPHGQRTAIVCLKTRSTPSMYPRDPGTPAKLPLWMKKIPVMLKWRHALSSFSYLLLDGTYGYWNGERKSTFTNLSMFLWVRRIFASSFFSWVLVAH